MQNIRNSGRINLHLPVIVITSFDDPKYRQCSQDHGAIAYLRKPIDGEALIDIIQYKLVNQQLKINIS